MKRSWLFITAIILSLVPMFSQPASAIQTPSEEAQAILDRMTPEERVGQLFLITFTGPTISPEDMVYDLIQNHHVSGVLLKSEMDNLVDPPSTLVQVKELNQDLQRIEFEGSQTESLRDPDTGEFKAPEFIPLFIGINQEGNGAPNSAIHSSLSSIPSAMAVGATWDEILARRVGELQGAELTDLGVNLLFGPSLDLLIDPRSSSEGALGVRAYGGDPYWVSRLGKGYIEGVHMGSEGHIAVIAKHFPGLGESDRPIEEEVATVRKSLDQLEQIELVPFFAVTQTDPGMIPGTADGLLISHIRYQGFQGNIRATTRPVSFDPETFTQLMSLEPLQSWKDGGGITISDSLGSSAVRKFYDSLGTSYKGHLVARDAFLAGNDLLLLDEFLNAEDPDEATTIRNTLEFFTQKYEEDAVFAERVDLAVLGILELKLRLFDGEFALETDSSVSESIGNNPQLAFNIASRAASLISPSAEELRNREFEAPQIDDRILFVTDVRTRSQCSTCDRQYIIGPESLEETILRLYGPRAAGQVWGWNLSSITMADLVVYLGENPPSLPTVPIKDPDEVGDLIEAADWLVFVTLNTDPNVYGSNSLQLLLDRRADLALEKQLVVFSLDVPYDLDATEISKIDVYYALFSRIEPFVDVAARLLFQEILATGTSPVSIPGAGYDLIASTAPDPDQIIPLNVTSAVENGEGVPIEEAGYSIGDTIRVMTGLIIDSYAHPVPDGTPVDILISYQNESIPARIETTTTSGIAQSTLDLDRAGGLTIRVESEPARTSEIIEISVEEGELAVVTVITPTSEPSVTAIPTVTQGLISTPTEGVEDGVAVITTPQVPDIAIIDFAAALLGIAVVVIFGYAAIWRTEEDPVAPVRCTMMVIIGGLVAYNYLALKLPGSIWIIESLGLFGGFLSGLLGGAIGLAVAYSFLRFENLRLEDRSQSSD